MLCIDIGSHVIMPFTLTLGGSRTISVHS